jgi:hypothetical protein
VKTNKTNYIKLFPTTASITEDFLTSKEVKYLLQVVKKYTAKEHILLFGDATSSWDDTKNILVKDTPIYDKIVRKLNEYTSTTGLSEMTITNSWFNIQKPNSRIDIHNHDNSKVSAALYLKVDKDSSNLILHDVHPFHNWRERNHINEYNYNSYIIKPKVGMLVLFPSWLNHSGDVNQSKERIVLSFNANDILVL